MAGLCVVAFVPVIGELFGAGAAAVNATKVASSIRKLNGVYMFISNTASTIRCAINLVKDVNNMVKKYVFDERPFGQDTLQELLNTFENLVCTVGNGKKL